jgi:ATP-dependent 26S proteasome regulatory subunit
MSQDFAQWQGNNDHFLAAALAWLRLLLTHLANGERARSSVTGVVGPAPAGSGLFSFMPGQPTAPSPAPGPPASELSLARRQMDEAAAADPPPALHLLGERFGLSPFEQNVLLLCAGMELDTRIAGLCAQAQDNPSRPYPTFALALALFDDPAWDALSPERPLRRWRLVEINQPPAQPLTVSALRADERIVNYLKGLNYLDDRLDPLLAPFDAVPDGVELPPSQQQTVALVKQHLERAAAMGRPPVIQLLGMDGLSKQVVAWQAAADFGLQLYRMPVELLPAQVADLETLARLWQRESVLLPIALYLDAHESAGQAPAEGQAPPLNRFLARSGGVFFLDVREIRPDLPGALSASVEVDKPAPAEQQAAWRAALGDAGGDAAAQLAGQFNLNQAAIQQIGRSVTMGRAVDMAPPVEQVWATCLANTRPRMDLLAQRLEPKATWEDIVLPAEVEKLLRQIAGQVAQRSTVYDEWGFRARMNRGLGISALFAGESGTGKTMAAEVLANDLRLNLYRIDLSAVVSKYIGETEKNLRRLFDAAEDGGAILFFDEADALFGRRSEVKDSHDRYANIEVNYLLQRMEAYRGLAILATNLKSALDPAFWRRLRFIVNFPFPGVEDRARIWQRVFPPQAPLEGLDTGRLARLNLAGGSIHNIALNAAFLAAQQGRPVSMPLVLAAAEAEFRKLERPVREADFAWNQGTG